MTIFIKNMYYFFINIIIRIKNLFLIKTVLNEESYYSEKKRKSYFKRFFENFIWIIKHVELNKYYNLYGFDVYSKTNQNDYIDTTLFMKQRNKKNGLYNKYSYIAILRDKYVFQKYMISNGINVVENAAISVNGIIYDNFLNKTIDSKKIFDGKKNYFIKSLDDECGRGIYCICNQKDYEKIKIELSKGVYVIQEKIIQHKEMEKINPNSINTLRIITINKDNNIHIFGILLRIGTKKSGIVDNSSQGGIVVPVSKIGKLNEYGFSKPGYGGLRRSHPDTKVIFSQFKIPFFYEALDLVKKAHKTLYKIHSIGWDVAITKDGPILIEGNDNWEIQSIQAIGGLKQKWNRYL